MTLVLPDPAPATIRRGPSIDCTASACLSFSSDERSKFIGLACVRSDPGCLWLKQMAKRRTKGLTSRRKVAYNRVHAIVLALLPELQGESCAKRGFVHLLPMRKGVPAQERHGRLSHLPAALRCTA